MPNKRVMSTIPATTPSTALLRQAPPTCDDAPRARRVPPHVDHSELRARLDRLRRLARLMDSWVQVPGLGIKLGLDPIVGLVPVAGDVVTTAISLYILHQARAMGVSSGTLWKMAGNIAIDFFVGEIPALGDVFDLVFKANVRNLALIERELRSRGVHL